MITRKISLLGPLAIWVLMLLIPLVGFAHKAAADNNISDLTQICVPKYKTVSGKKWADGWVGMTWVNRATIRFTYTANKTCQTPSGLDSTHFYQSTLFKDIMNRISGQDNVIILTDCNTGDDVVRYEDTISSNGCGDQAHDDSTVFDFFGLENATKDNGDSGRDKIVNVTPYLAKTQFILSFEKNKVQDWSCSAPGDDNPNFTLTSDNGWVCNPSNDVGNSGSFRGFLVDPGAYSSNDNFNITYNALVAGSVVQVQHVSGGQQADRTFSWCPDPSDNSKSLFLNHDCKNPNLILHATKDQITNIGSGTADFPLGKYDAKTFKADPNTTMVRIAGSTNPSNTGGGPSCDPTQDPTCTPTQTDEGLCEVNAIGFSLSWLFCPVLAAANAVANTLTATFEEQLSFTLQDQNHATGAVSTSGQQQLKKAWSIFRLIASSLLVVILLVVIVSEAIGAGPFDAYAIRKMLPRVVAAVIIIQLSWPIGVWIVNAVDDLARQLANIMYLPFGGPKNMSLGALMTNAHIDTGTGALFSWIGVIGIIIAAAFALPIVLMFCFMAIMAILTGLIVLIFRKIVIILALLLMPVALLTWILPGTQRYWKLWQDNFSKALMMFPLAMAMIAGGRIFAYVAASQNVGTLLNFLIVLVGFFGPLFILPKTWKWGGQTMRLIGQGAQQASTKLQERPNKYLKGRQEDWSANRRRDSQERVGGKKEFSRFKVPFTNKQFGSKKFYEFPLDRFRSGAWDPLRGGKGSRNRFEATAQYAAAGRESSGKTYEAAKAAAQQLFDTAADHDAVAQMLMRGGDFQYIDKKGRLRTYTAPKAGPGKGYMRAAGAAGIAKYGTDGSNRVFQAEIDRMRAAGGDEALLAEEILDENVGTMKGKMDSMYRGFNRHEYQKSLDDQRRRGVREEDLDYQHATRMARRPSIHSSIDSMKEDWFQGMEGVEAQSLLAGLSQGVREGDTESIDKMRKLWRNYQAAVANPNIQIAPGVHKAFKAYADGNPTSTSRGKVEEINDDRDNEVMTRIRGDITDPETGVVIERRDERKQVRAHPVLDKIDDSAANRNLMPELDPQGITSDFDGDGAPEPGAQARRAAGGTGTTARAGRPPAGTTTPRPSGPSFFDPDSMDSGTVHFYHERSPGPSPSPAVESATESRPLSVSHDEAPSGASEASPEVARATDQEVGVTSGESVSGDVLRAAAAAGAAAGARAASDSARLSTGQVSAEPVAQATNPGETVAPGAVIAPTARDSAGQGLGREANRELVEAIQENTRAQQKVQTELKRQKPGASQNFPAAPNEVTIVNREEPPQTPPAP